MTSLDLLSKSSLRCVRAWQWTREDAPCGEYAELHELHDGWALAGSVVLSWEGTPFLAEYSVESDSRWRTRQVHVALRGAGVSRTLDLRVDAEQRWWRGGEEVVAFAGCVDVDLAFSPATNTLPIRRLSLEVGQGSDVTAAWVRMPDLSLEKLPQRYTRLSSTRYRYESGGGRFTSEVETDELGLVTHYPPAWVRVTSASR